MNNHIVFPSFGLVCLLTDQFQLWYLHIEKEVKPPTKEGQELLKKQLVKWCKANLSAQVANHAWNRFNSIINHKVKELSTQNKVHILKLQSTLFKWYGLSQNLFAMFSYLKQFDHLLKGRYKSRTGSTRTASPGRINSDQLRSTRIVLDHDKKHKIKWNWNFYPFEG